ncbi:hypothetical protein GE21DRAFT_5319 [Neurospora crassa]|uniref:Uncharacterized protein n=1 Tax=Neurospora crassa (strain ATCC 24698 / 74-OR23-1A / CBS 708.71 / DSM 1257 / FGSC 987) TaxID=367110 RepID=Q7S369_NEUCR|nr:hypothetical protein NCU04876 [Neurospora crassa OR74A]EAA29897.1 hypothetical protein NCU04876 [Neurospora crassa OR74A]KHE81903.1 hypothetical protein GE21DRAFT_5319 [Neurospora crassa]|eukprot:XP_959133.1 hypothetical protein NCU04876 [Neurospora crassa OR74A]
MTYPGIVQNTVSVVTALPRKEGKLYFGPDPAFRLDKYCLDTCIKRLSAQWETPRLVTTQVNNEDFPLFYPKNDATSQYIAEASSMVDRVTQLTQDPKAS